MSCRTMSNLFSRHLAQGTSLSRPGQITGEKPVRVAPFPAMALAIHHSLAERAPCRFKFMAHSLGGILVVTRMEESECTQRYVWGAKKTNSQEKPSNGFDKSKLNTSVGLANTVKASSQKLLRLLPRSKFHSNRKCFICKKKEFTLVRKDSKKEESL